MMHGVTFKNGVQINGLAKAGVRILGALDLTARRLGVDLVVTCGTEAHPPEDMHTKGCALDVRTHDFTDDQKRSLLRELMIELMNDFATDAPVPVGIGLATSHFYGQLEHLGEPTEHCHVQLRRFTEYE